MTDLTHAIHSHPLKRKNVNKNCQHPLGKTELPSLGWKSLQKTVTLCLPSSFSSFTTNKDCKKKKFEKRTKENSKRFQVGDSAAISFIVETTKSKAKKSQKNKLVRKACFHISSFVPTHFSLISSFTVSLHVNGAPQNDVNQMSN